MVISSTNPVHSIFSLVLVFANSSALLLMIGRDASAEFLALLFIIVYVGAIAILFLFVVMMLNIKMVEIADNASRYVPIGVIIGFIFLVDVYDALGATRAN
jgi:NADH-quinone oxidoreductase subunit J